MSGDRNFSASRAAVKTVEEEVTLTVPASVLRIHQECRQPTP